MKDSSVSIHHRDIRMLAIELYKVKNNLSSKIMLELFQRWEVNYNICSQTDFSLRSINTNSCGLKSLRYLAPKIWNLLPQVIRSENSLSQFIREIKLWIPDGCPCVLCHTYIGQVGYINQTCTHKLSCSEVINKPKITSSENGNSFFLFCLSRLYRLL